MNGVRSQCVSTSEPAPFSKHLPNTYSGSEWLRKSKDLARIVFHNFAEWSPIGGGKHGSVLNHMGRRRQRLIGLEGRSHWTHFPPFRQGVPQ